MPARPIRTEPLRKDGYSMFIINIGKLIMTIGSVPPFPTHHAVAADTAASGSSSKQAESSPAPTAGEGQKRKASPLVHAFGNKRPKWIPPLEGLPNELLLKITGYLDSPDLGGVRLTNRRLNDIGSKHITHLKFDKPDKLKEAVNIFTSRGQIDKIRSITLAGVYFRDEHLSMLAEFTKVEELHLDQCRNLTHACAPHISRFSHLKKLDVSGCWEITDQFVAGLYPATAGKTVDIALEEISFAGCNYLTDACASDISRFRHLKKLDVRECWHLTDQFVAQLYPATPGETVDVVLEEVNFNYCQRLTDACASDISRFRHLKKLDVSECGQLTDQFVAQLYPATQGETVDVALEEVNFRRCNFTDACAPDISRFRHLKKLDVSQCYEITDQFVTQLYLAPAGETLNVALEEVNFNCCHQLTDACAPDISRFRHLKKLDVSECGQLTDQFVAQLYPATAGETLDVALEHVNFAGCNQLTDECARHISRFRHLKKLGVSKCVRLTNQFVAQLYPVAAGEISDVALEEVNFNCCPKLTDACAPDISRFLHIKKLDVSMCYEITDQFVAQLYPATKGETVDIAMEEVNFSCCLHLTDACAPDISRFRHLKKLDVGRCWQLTDQFVAGLYPSTEGEPVGIALEEVHFNYCRRLTDACAPSISRFRHLKKLDVSGCSRLTNQFVAQLYPAVGGKAVDVPLKEVNFSHCHPITDEDLVSLAARAKGLHFIEDQ